MDDRIIDKGGPGAATAAAEIPIVEVDSHGGHVLEPEWKRLPIGPDHILYSVVVGLALFVWPFIDAIGGPRLAKRLGWKSWPVPGRNIITGTGWVLFLAFIALLTLWALAGPQFCLPWFINNPVCGA